MGAYKDINTIPFIINIFLDGHFITSRYMVVQMNILNFFPLARPTPVSSRSRKRLFTIIHWSNRTPLNVANRKCCQKWKLYIFFIKFVSQIFRISPSISGINKWYGTISIDFNYLTCFRSPPFSLFISATKGLFFDSLHLWIRNTKCTCISLWNLHEKVTQSSQISRLKLKTLRGRCLIFFFVGWRMTEYILKCASTFKKSHPDLLFLAQKETIVNIEFNPYIYTQANLEQVCYEITVFK